MRHGSIVLLSSAALFAFACGDDTSSTTTTGGTSSSAATGGGAGTSATSSASSSASSTSSSTSAGGSAGSGGAAGAGTGGTAGTTGAGGSAGSGGSSGAGGSGGAGGGTDAGSDASGSTDASKSDGGSASDSGGGPRAVANIMPFSTGTITGTATFTASGADVTIVVSLENCPQGAHPMHIHQGTGCGSETEQGLHWDPPRGENIGPNGGEITCGADQKGTLTYTRAGTNANPWTIGGAQATNVIGHPIVVHGVGAGNSMRHGCGVITMQ